MTYLIVVGVDGSEAGQRALSWAVAESTRRREPTSVQAVTTWQFDPLDEPEGVAIRLPDPRATAGLLLDDAIAKIHAEAPGITIAAEVLEGDAADTLVRASAEADLLVLGSHGHSQIFHAVLGSVAEACVRKATCPVVVIPVARAVSPHRTAVEPATAA